MRELILTEEFWFQEFGKNVVDNIGAFHHYINLIKFALKDDYLTDGEYYEKHHIIPKSFNLDKFNKPKWNIVKLKARDHYLAHCYLVDALSGEYKRSMAFALHKMSYGIHSKGYKITSEEYEKVKQLHSDNVSNDNVDRWKHMTTTERTTVGKNISKGKKQSYAKMTDDERKEKAEQLHTPAANKKHSETLMSKTLYERRKMTEQGCTAAIKVNTKYFNIIGVNKDTNETTPVFFNITAVVDWLKENVNKKADRGGIRKCLLNKCKTAYGYIWMFEEDYIKLKEAQKIKENTP